MILESSRDLDGVNWYNRFSVWVMCICAKSKWFIDIPKKIQESKHPGETREELWLIMPGTGTHEDDQDPCEADEEFTRLVRQSSNFQVQYKVLKKLDIRVPWIKVVLVIVAGFIVLCICIGTIGAVIYLCIGHISGRRPIEDHNTTAKITRSEENLSKEAPTTTILPEIGNNSSSEAPDIGNKYTVKPTESSFLANSEIDHPPLTTTSEGVAVTLSISRRRRINSNLTGVCRRAMFDVLDLAKTSDAYECLHIGNEWLKEDDRRHSTRVDKFSCSTRACYFSKAIVFKNLSDTYRLAADDYLIALKFHPRPNCEALQIGTLNEPPVFSSLLMLQIHMKNLEECPDLHLYVSRMEMPRLSSLDLNKIVASETSWEPLQKILEKSTVKHFSVNNSTCDSCSFDGIDAGKFTTARFFWTNGHETRVTRVVEQFINQASNLDDFGWNSPIPVRELWRTLQKMPKLKVAELTVELEQVGGKAEFNLSRPEHGNLENLNINLVVKNQTIKDVGVKICVRLFEWTGQNLSRIRLHATHPANILKTELSAECWIFEADDDGDNTVQCTKRVRPLLGA